MERDEPLEDLWVVERFVVICRGLERSSPFLSDEFVLLTGQQGVTHHRAIRFSERSKAQGPRPKVSELTRERRK